MNRKPKIQCKFVRSVARCDSQQDSSTPNPHAKAQLDLLSRLIGGGEGRAKSARTEIRLNLFNSAEEEE